MRNGGIVFLVDIDRGDLVIKAIKQNVNELLGIDTELGEVGFILNVADHLIPIVTLLVDDRVELSGQALSNDLLRRRTVVAGAQRKHAQRSDQNKRERREFLLHRSSERGRGPAMALSMFPQAHLHIDLNVSDPLLSTSDDRTLFEERHRSLPVIKKRTPRIRNVRSTSN